MLQRLAARKLARIQSSKPRETLVVSDPVEFIRDKLQDKLWSRQIELVRSTWENTITGCISGQKTGKTRCAADIAVAWCKGHSNGIVRLASASEDQLIDGLWGEIRRLLLNHPELGPAPALAPSTGWRLSENQKIIGVTAKEANRMAGRSGEEQLWIVDEACGIDYPLWEVILGNLMGGGHLLWLTNPVTIGGKVYDWDTKPDSAANIVRIDARETPNFPGSKDYTGEIVPGLATPDGVDNIRKDYGEDSAEFDVRVRGRFPRQGSNAVIPLGLAEDAIKIWDATPNEGPLTLGVDVARFGDDDSCVTPRRGLKPHKPRPFHGLDNVQLATKVVEIATELRLPGEPVALVVEVNGTGSGVVDTLNSWIEDKARGLGWLRLLAFDAGATAEEDERYVNRRSELWFAGQEFLKAGGAFPPDQRLKGELIAPVYSFDAKMRRKVESKDEIKKKTKRSPDVADSFLLSLVSVPEPVDDGYDPSASIGTYNSVLNG